MNLAIICQTKFSVLSLNTQWERLQSLFPPPSQDLNELRERFLRSHSLLLVELAVNEQLFSWSIRYQMSAKRKISQNHMQISPCLPVSMNLDKPGLQQRQGHLQPMNHQKDNESHGEQDNISMANKQLEKCPNKHLSSINIRYTLKYSIPSL